MIRLHLFNLLMLVAILWPVSESLAHSGNVPYKRVLNRNFAVHSGAALNIHNKFGKIVLHHWEGNEVKAVITVTGFGKDLHEAQEMAEQVEIDAQMSAENVSFVTVYNPSVSSFWSKWFFPFRREGKEYVNIDYEVYLPKSLRSLTVTNSFGDLFADELLSGSFLRLNYCNYKIGTAGNSLEMNLNYCKGTVSHAADVLVNANYSELNLNTARSLHLKSNYCKYNFGQVSSLTSHSNYDDFRLEKIGELNTSSNFTDYKIGVLDEQAEMRLVYGDASISKLASSLKGINISGSFANIRLSINEKNPLQLFIRVTHGDIDTDELFFRNISRSDNHGVRSFSGFTTGGNEQSPLIKISGTSLDVVLKKEK